MAKKNPGKAIQMLSPEKYIQTRAPTLPIYECLVNTEWKEEGIANIIMARNHTNGNLTVCFYMIDLFCLGVKDTDYKFNISKDEYQDIICSDDNIRTLEISYALAHNIIYAGLEYAEELGFKPHKDFTSVTRFMLEEDTVDVEFIEVECGKDGKPFYISGPYDNEQHINSVNTQLEKSVGAGNYEYLALEKEDEIDPEKENDEELDEGEGH